MNDLIMRAMGAPKPTPFSFMALLASVGGIPVMDDRRASPDRAFFGQARAKINAFAADHRFDGYGFFRLMEDNGFMPRASEHTVANVMGTAANDNSRAPRLVPPGRPKAPKAA